MKVIMYTISTDPWCGKTKQFFKDRGVPVDCKDYDMASDEEQKHIVKDMRKFTDHIAFPFVRIGDQVIVGYNPIRYDEILKRAALE